MSYHIYGIGNALVDKEFEVEDRFFDQAGIEKGMMTLIDEERLNQMLPILENQYGLKKRACGGSAANSIIAASQLGANTFYSCNVANDESGDFYTADLKAEGVDTNLGEVRPEGLTGKCLVMVTPDAERTMNSFLGITADLDDSHIDESAIADSRYVYIEGYLVTGDASRAAAIKVRELARQQGVKVALTCSDPAMTTYFRDGLLEMIGPGVDMLFCNEQEALLLTDTQDLASAITKIKEIASQFAITLGSKGAIAWDGVEQHSIQTPTVQALDTNGAGDMFAGAFLYGITHSYSFPSCGQLAAAAAAHVVGQYGPRLNKEDLLKIKKDILK